jgi:hypothetical protein
LVLAFYFAHNGCIELDVEALAGEKMLNIDAGGGGGAFMRARACEYAQQKLGASAASSVSHFFAFIPLLDFIGICNIEFFSEKSKNFLEISAYFMV